MMNKQAVSRFLRIAITTLLLTYVFHQAGLTHAQGWKDLLATLTQVNQRFVFLSIFIGALAIFSSSLKWYMLVRPQGLNVSLWRLCSYYLVGRFFSMVLPTSMGGDVVRMHQLGKYTGQYSNAAASVFIERFSGMITLASLALMMIFLNLHRFQQPWLIVAFGLSVGIASIVIFWLILDQRPLLAIQSWVAKRKIKFLSKGFEKAEKFRQSVLQYKNKPALLWIALMNSVIFYCIAIVNVWVTALVFEDHLSFMAMVSAVPIILLIMNLPVSIGDLGLMEFGYSFTLGLFSISPTVALSTALLFRVKGLIFAGCGGLLYGALSSQNKDLDYVVSAPDNNLPR